MGFGWPSSLHWGRGCPFCQGGKRGICLPLGPLLPASTPEQLTQLRHGGHARHRAGVRPGRRGAVPRVVGGAPCGSSVLANRIHTHTYVLMGRLRVRAGSVWGTSSVVESFWRVRARGWWMLLPGGEGDIRSSHSAASESKRGRVVRRRFKRR